MPGWTLAGYGDRTLQVVEVEKARGARALQVDIAGNQGAVVALEWLLDSGAQEA